MSGKFKSVFVYAKSAFDLLKYKEQAMTTQVVLCLILILFMEHQDIYHHKEYIMELHF